VGWFGVVRLPTTKFLQRDGIRYAAYCCGRASISDVVDVMLSNMTLMTKMAAAAVMKIKSQKWRYLRNGLADL